MDTWQRNDKGFTIHGRFQPDALQKHSSITSILSVKPVQGVQGWEALYEYYTGCDNERWVGKSAVVVVKGQQIAIMGFYAGWPLGQEREALCWYCTACNDENQMGKKSAVEG